MTNCENPPTCRQARSKRAPLTQPSFAGGETHPGMVRFGEKKSAPHLFPRSTSTHRRYIRYLGLDLVNAERQSLPARLFKAQPPPPDTHTHTHAHTSHPAIRTYGFLYNLQQYCVLGEFGWCSLVSTRGILDQWPEDKPATGASTCACHHIFVSCHACSSSARVQVEFSA